ncbi:hypothetical protein [Sphingomonas faeni]|uniref:hypothetical protein n=1 Tax=Sphingomonas faeni TaxID=185950 RepID=UPI0033506F07
MIITVAFEVKNYVNVMECWPIKKGDITFFLEREDDVLKRVCIAFSGVGIEHAPSFEESSTEGEAPLINIRGAGYAALARKNIMNWQAVVSGQQIDNLDYDNYELRFNAENIDEDSIIHIKSFKTNSDKALNSTCDFEQIGRAFCVGPIADDRIESTSHYREGRIAFEAHRFVDSYNNMFLFLETRYCDGKTKTAQQVELLLKEPIFCESLRHTLVEFVNERTRPGEKKFDFLKITDGIRDQIKTLVMVRGSLRHHSLKSPFRWDPNKQDEYESAARFLGAVVGHIVITESLADIYAPETLKSFREISISTGFETKIRLDTRRLDKKRTLSLNMSYPTTVISSRLCATVLRNAIKACANDGQLADTVRFEGTNTKSGLDVTSLEFGIWAYTPDRSIALDKPSTLIECEFEHFREGIITKANFTVPFNGNKLTIPDVWELVTFSFDHIERREPATRIMKLRLIMNDSTMSLVTYRVGSQVRN